ncbi:AlpA family phage regulatory protein [Altererythrobacter sp. HHU K3-1]|uniref:AlpA family phage regulatory protein n=2 Tax=Qipengyuania atrilutea TaxID=2744473 RepID=A0A850GVE3_9SPHN|nr:AlpA family phage regulatory protein [Actirhodobacter atriluteus]
MTQTTQAPDRLLRLPQVIEIVGISRSMVYRLMRRGDFPQAYKPGGYASRWSEAEVMAWREEQRGA